MTQHSPHILIDRSGCIGCGLCASVCIRGNIKVSCGKAEESNGGPYECFECGHCASVCPKGAISLRSGGDMREYDPKE